MTGDPRKALLIDGLRRAGIADEPVLAAIAAVPRELFVEEAFGGQAYADQALPISCGQTISQPYIVAVMTEHLAVSDRHTVLEIGTGSGYQTAILAALCRRVCTIERYRTLSRRAAERLAQLKLTNITQMVGDGMKGWPQLAPFERIIVTAAAKEAPPALLEQLAAGGIMVIPIEERPGKQDLFRISRSESGCSFEHLLPVRFVPLVEGVAKEN